MQTDPTQPLNLYYCCAPEDKVQREELDKHFATLKRLGHINARHDDNISAGTERIPEIHSLLNTADIILLLISKNFLHNDHCYHLMQLASERHTAAGAYVFAILLQPAYWKDIIPNDIPKLPANHRPITRWPNRNQAYHDVVET